MAGRPVPRKLEIEVFERFRRWDLKGSERLREKYPHLVKPRPGLGAPGTGSVKWVGLNPDPCRAKFLEKQRKSRGTCSSPALLTGARPASAPSLHSSRACTPARMGTPATLAGSTTAEVDSNKGPQIAAPRRLLRPSSAPAGDSRGAGAKRDLARMTAVKHYLEQSFKLPGMLPPETFGPSGAWPSKGATKTGRSPRVTLYGSKEGGNGMGRHAYLRARRTIAPQDKTPLPATAAHEVGWQHSSGKPARIILPVRDGGAKCVCPG
ncbi:unnamed protein product [Polarella glacialis]|uniref:Sperm microtubule inner protein 1 C-terminal domain-containing protein n=1 Tax=Polarella glacialis TaxID=89957 RepID=A0A813H844_POLGL|nr:unnamed protein product [Polarella glacialis]